MKSIFKNNSIKYLSIVAFLSLGMVSCSDDEPVDDPYFSIDGVSSNLVIDASGNSLESFDSGKIFDVKARGDWELRPVDGEEPEWARIYPLTGSDDGVIRVYVETNSLIQRRQSVYNLYINGILQDYTLTIDQDPTPAKMTLNTNTIHLKTAGGESSVKVTSNVDWTLEYDESLNWLNVRREDNFIYFTAPSVNNTGGRLSTKVVVCGLPPYEDSRLEINVTQLFALYSEDFNWFGDDSKEPVCWNTSGEPRLDQWPSKFADKVSDPAILTAWTGMNIASGGVICYATHNYLKMGTGQRAANLCSPAIPAIEGAVNVNVSWSMAGFTKKNNERADGNEFYVGILGPGRITEAIANGTSDGWVDKTVKIPYSSTGAGTVYDTEISEVAGFRIGSDGFFSTNDMTGLNVWNAPESQFSIKVEGMTNATRIVFIGCEPDKVNGLGECDWLNTFGSYADNRKLFDNFVVEPE